MAIMHNYLAVIGRIPGEDEDTMLKFEHMSVDRAKGAFEERMYRYYSDGNNETAEQERKDVISRYGDAIYISFVLTSVSPIGDA